MNIKEAIQDRDPENSMQELNSFIYIYVKETNAMTSNSSKKETNKNGTKRIYQLCIVFYMRLLTHVDILAENVIFVLCHFHS